MNEDDIKKQQEIYEYNLKLHEAKESTAKKIENYECNLKLHLDVMLNELRIILSSSMPHQVNNIKTILWINMLFIGLSGQFILKNDFELIYLSFYIPIVISIGLLLVALLSRRYKYYGSVEPDYSAKKIYNNKHPQMSMLTALLGTTDDAIQKNKEIMSYIAKFMRFATLLTFIALFIASSIFIFQTYMKGGDVKMAEEKPPEIPTEQVQPSKPTHEAEERSLGNVTIKTTNNSNSSEQK